MKRCNMIIYGLLLLLFTACDANYIDNYELGAKLNFEGDWIVDNLPQNLCRFNDADYLNGITEKVDSVKVKIMDVAVDSERIFCCKTLFDEQTPHVEVVLEDLYVIPANVYSTYIYYVVKAPGQFRSEHRTYILFDFDDPKNDFEEGYAEGKACIVSSFFEIEPDGWHETFWGVYSDGKYKFMMDQFESLYGNITRTPKNLTFIKEKYQEYRQTNPPIMDDQYPAQEIVF